MSAVLVSVTYRAYMWAALFQLYITIFDQIVFCGVLVLGETIAHYHFCAAAANMLTLAAISPRQDYSGYVPLHWFTHK